jgi:quinol monooxygenase YgiN
MDSTPSQPTRVTVLARLTARPGKETELRETLTALLGPTRKEPGCLQYDLNTALDDPARFLLHGNWESQGHLDAHYRTSHLMLALRRLDEMCTEAPQIEFWRHIG